MSSSGEIDLGAVRYNMRKIKEIVGCGTKILGVVKADAYGHGMNEVSKAIVKEGVSYLGVASLDEARELRGIGIKKDIIVLNTGKGLFASDNFDLLKSSISFL